MRWQEQNVENARAGLHRCAFRQATRRNARSNPRHNRSHGQCSRCASRCVPWRRNDRPPRRSGARQAEQATSRHLAAWTRMRSRHSWRRAQAAQRGGDDTGQSCLAKRRRNSIDAHHDSAQSLRDARQIVLRPRVRQGNRETCSIRSLRARRPEEVPCKCHVPASAAHTKTEHH